LAAALLVSLHVVVNRTPSITPGKHETQVFVFPLGIIAGPHIEWNVSCGFTFSINCETSALQLRVRTAAPRLQAPPVAPLPSDSDDVIMTDGPSRPRLSVSAPVSSASQPVSSSFSSSSSASSSNSAAIEGSASEPAKKKQRTGTGGDDAAADLSSSAGEAIPKKEEEDEDAKELPGLEAAVCTFRLTHGHVLSLAIALPSPVDVATR